MSINLAAFTPTSSFIGGMIIGLATLILLLVNGKIAGISGILGGLFNPKKNDTLWRALFIIGLALSPLCYLLLAPLPVIEIHTNNIMIIIAGFLVGIGSRLGSGCTSGHGVCGLSRFSLRSLVATLSVMLAGFITVFISHKLR